MLNITRVLQAKPGAAALMLLMAVSRFHHFGTAFSLPDASLAVFFLAGLWFGGRNLFIALLVEAGLIDYLAITQLGVSDFCISSAYVFLIPTYAAMWLAGKWSSRFTSLQTLTLLKQFTALAVGTTAAFVISNASFYLLSGRYVEKSWEQYVERVVVYYPSYLSAALMYSVLIFALVHAVKWALADKNSREII
jgi:hypothetical protein